MSRIVIFDSGVGGLSIYRAVQAKNPNFDYVFVSDNAAFPYGTKSESALIDRVTQVLERVAERYAPDILVVACNTASTVMLPILRERFDFEVVGVVPAIKPAAAISQSRRIGLLATPATIERDYTNNLIEEFANDCEVFRVGSSELVEISEQKMRGLAPEPITISTILEPFVSAADLDVLVLACTHFPLLKNEIDDFFKMKNMSVWLVDSSAGIANRVEQIGVGRKTKALAAIAVFTEEVDEPSLIEHITYLGFSEIEFLPI